jgi:hypothetical protein
MPHPLVEQLRFTRAEFKRAFDGVTPEEGRRRFEPINSLGWMVGHLAGHEQNLWLIRAQGITLAPDVLACGGGRPASTPPLDAMWGAWQAITEASEAYLDRLTTEQLTAYMIVNEKPAIENIGTMLRRLTYHYWFHLGESQAVRQLLGHQNLPSFVGALHTDAPYIPE